MIKNVFLPLLAIFSTLSAVQEPFVEFKTGYFFFSDSKMRKIYDRGGLDLQLSGSYPICDLSCNWSLNAYGAVEYFHRFGKSLNGHQKTSIWSVPVNIGLKSIYAINSEMQYYLAFGPRYFYIHQHNCSEYVPEQRSRNGIGAFANTGIHYLLCDQWGLDLFGEYSYATIHFHRGKTNSYSSKIQVGGFTFGGGLGYVY